MCTTYLGAVLSPRLAGSGFRVGIPRLLRLNPNVPWKTRGNAAICIEAEGDPEEAFRIACSCVEELAVLRAPETHPGVVVVEDPPEPAFYRKALQDFCTVGEAREVLEAAGARSRGWKLGRGLIGAAAAVSADLPDATWELLAYRTPAIAEDTIGDDTGESETGSAIVDFGEPHPRETGIVIVEDIGFGPTGLDEETGGLDLGGGCEPPAIDPRRSLIASHARATPIRRAPPRPRRERVPNPPTAACGC